MGTLLSFYLHRPPSLRGVEWVQCLFLFVYYVGVHAKLGLFNGSLFSAPYKLKDIVTDSKIDREIRELECDVSLEMTMRLTECVDYLFLLSPNRCMGGWALKLHCTFKFLNTKATTMKYPDTLGPVAKFRCPAEPEVTWVASSGTQICEQNLKVYSIVIPMYPFMHNNACQILSHQLPKSTCVNKNH